MITPIIVPIDRKPKALIITVTTFWKEDTSVAAISSNCLLQMFSLFWKSQFLTVASLVELKHFKTEFVNRALNASLNGS